MILYKDVVIRHDKGLHARVLAMVVHKVSELEKENDITFYIIYKDKKKILATSLMPLVLLKVKKNEKITVEAHGEEPKEALDRLCDFLQSDFNLE